MPISTSVLIKPMAPKEGPPSFSNGQSVSSVIALPPRARREHAADRRADGVATAGLGVGQPVKPNHPVDHRGVVLDRGHLDAGLPALAEAVVAVAGGVVGALRFRSFPFRLPYRNLRSTVTPQNTRV